MAEVKTKRTRRCKVILVDAESLKQDTTPTTGVVAPRYDRERDEPAFQRAWERIAAIKAQGQLKPVPTEPVGGIRLRGSRKT